MRIFSFILAVMFVGTAIAENMCQWDSSIYNLIEHPRTVALRIEVVDSETALPIEDADVSFKGTYYLEGRTSRHPEGERNAEIKDYELSCRTDSAGIAIGAFGWHKEYPWANGNDDVEKVQTIEVRHTKYQYVEVSSPFERFLNVGQRFESTSQEPSVFEAFEQAWHDECCQSDVKFCVLDLGTGFSDFGNEYSGSPEFFEKIYNKNWGKTYQEPCNWFSKGQSPQSLCGPYFVYLIEIPMNKDKASRRSLIVRIQKS